jgi:hypothetical protein
MLETQDEWCCTASATRTTWPSWAPTRRR